MSFNDSRSGSQLISGRYRILSPLHEGGFGQTFLVEDTHLPSQRRCVLKLLKPVEDNPAFYRVVQDRFQREAAIQETLGEVCQQIPRLYAYFTEGDRFYLVEEWIEGDTLSAKVAEVGRFSEVAVAAILTQLLPTVDAVHRHQIVHRDIKPDNIILRKRDGKPVLIDFGAVKESMGAIVNSQGVSGHSIVIGTAGYMAPEQSAGRPLYASDLYSLGLTAIYLLTGRSPVELHSDPHTGKIEWRSQAPQVSADLGRVIDTAIQMHPQDRFASAEAMLQSLESIQPQALKEDIPTLISQPQAGNQSPVWPVAAPLPPNQPFNQPLRDPQPISPPNPYSNPPFNPVPQTQQTPPVNPPVVAQYPPVTTQPNTQVVSPVNSTSGTHQNQGINGNGNGNWIKAALIGGGIGGGLLLGLMMLRSQPSVVYVQPTPSPSTTASSSPVANTPSPTPTPSTEVSPEPSPEVSAPPSKEPSPPPISAAATCGDPSGSGQNWYPVFIDHGDLGQVRQQYCQDAIAKSRDNGTPTIQVASFTNRQRALEFADRVGGDVGDPYQVGGPKTNPTPPTAPPARADTNAVIVGDASAKNIRRGPGSNYPVQHIAYPGDRVKITGSDQDSGGYLWYQVYFPKSGASGWIAGQLIRPD